METGINLETVYKLRTDFSVIALTGRTCSGSTTIASQLGRGFRESDFPPPSLFAIQKHNSYRKYRIIYNYAASNFQAHSIINYKDVLVLFLLKFTFEELVEYIKSAEYCEEFKTSKFSINPDYTSELLELEKYRGEFEDFKKLCSSIDFSRIKEDDKFDEIHAIFDSHNYRRFCSDILNCLSINNIILRNKFLQVVANNLRKAGRPYLHGRSPLCPECIFTIAELINDILKSYNKANKATEKKTHIVIDSLRNPMEVMFFKQRFAAFYLCAVNRDSKDREVKLAERYKNSLNDITKLLDEEYDGGKGNEFFKQHVKDCIQKADIHITYRSFESTMVLNKYIKNYGDNTSPYFSWQMQLLKYISLIGQPGLVTPSPEERCMQMAYTAKYNSGCISRQVGATVTDEYYSIKAVGWNNTPEGQVPCNLRNIEDLMDNKEDVDAFTPYEHTSDFKKVLENKYRSQIKTNSSNLCGRNVCFCFKSLQNSISEGKNQVHTRSLHAEESAFLQITKYGRVGVKGGKLFTTASPCELCSKKAYQLGIKVIYYIDPYPGISQQQILEAGDPKRNPSVRLFNGAIGNAYHWLYEPFMAYKDELSLLIGVSVKDKLTQLQQDFSSKEKQYLSQISELKMKLNSKPEPESK